MDSTLARMSLRGWCACGLLAAIAGGCMAPIPSGYLAESRQQEAIQQQQPVDPVAAATDPTAVALRKANGQEPASPQEALAGVLDELEEIRAIDPAAQQQVMADLKDAKPEHYGLIVSQFKAALSYRRQLAERELAEREQLASDSADDADRDPLGPRARVVTRAARRADAERVTEHTRREVGPENDVLVADEAPTAAATVIAADEPDATRRDRAVQPATAVAPLAEGDWRAQLDATIAELERSVNPRPGTVVEVHEHLRLRALQLVAGRDEEAYRPIPGASAAQQDYWSKQLFAIGAYLKGDGPMDEKQRAAAALVHLDDARSSLAQLATLQIRNLAFVESVEGFGAYEPLKHAEFQPGDQVTIYAEVENFGSTAGVTGYETTLATSYQVLDSNDRRVEGAQFPDVSDTCRGRRRDFHLQYGITLPSRIYTGEYRIELTITDQQTGKIGHASLPFEIVAP